jgi:hypothetical protein
MERSSLESDYQSVSLLKSDFHIINQIVHAAGKIFEIVIYSKSYLFTKEQIILFSKAAFLEITKTNQSFNVLGSSDLSEEFLISSLAKSFSYFQHQKK